MKFSRQIYTESPRNYFIKDQWCEPNAKPIVTRGRFFCHAPFRIILDISTEVSGTSVYENKHRKKLNHTNNNFFKFLVIHGENLLFLKSNELLEYCTPVLMSN